MTIQKGDEVEALLNRIDGVLSEKEKAERRFAALHAERSVFGGAAPKAAESRIHSPRDFVKPGQPLLPNWELVLICSSTAFFAIHGLFYFVRYLAEHLQARVISL